MTSSTLLVLALVAACAALVWRTCVYYVAVGRALLRLSAPPHRGKREGEGEDEDDDEDDNEEELPRPTG